MIGLVETNGHQLRALCTYSRLRAYPDMRPAEAGNDAGRCLEKVRYGSEADGSSIRICVDQLVDKFSATHDIFTTGEAGHLHVAVLEHIDLNPFADEGQ
jgi:hypothetical protein